MSVYRTFERETLDQMAACVQAMDQQIEIVCCGSDDLRRRIKDACMRWIAAEDECDTEDPKSDLYRILSRIKSAGSALGLQKPRAVG